MNKVKKPTAWNRTVQKSKPKLLLYKIELVAQHNRNLSPRTEYIKSKLGLENLQKSIERFCAMPSTAYYGYTKVKITVEKDVPEMIQITI